MPHVTGHKKKDYGAITAVRKRAIRAEMLARWKKKLRLKGAAATAKGDVKAAGGTGSLKGWVTKDAAGKDVKLTKDEISYAQAVRKTQRKKSKADPEYKIPGATKTRKVVAKTARTTGAGDVKLVDAAKRRVATKRMKSVAKGGTVSFGSHKSAEKKKEAGAWRRKHMAAAGTDAAKIKKIKDRYKHMRGIKPKKK